MQDITLLKLGCLKQFDSIIYREDMVHRLLKRGTKEYPKTGLKPEFLAQMLETHGPSVPCLILDDIFEPCRLCDSERDLLLERVGPKLWTLSKELTRDSLANSGEDIQFTWYLLEKNAFALSGPMDRRFLCEQATGNDNFALLENFLNELGIPSFKHQTKGIGGSCRFEVIFREAAIIGSVDVFKFLLDRGHVLDSNNLSWGNILVEATRYNHLDIVNLFLDNGFDVNTHYRLSGTPEDSGWRSDSESDADPPGNAELAADVVDASPEFPPIRHVTMLEAAIFFVGWPACMFDIPEQDPPKIGMVRLLLDRGLTSTASIPRVSIFLNAIFERVNLLSFLKNSSLGVSALSFQSKLHMKVFGHLHSKLPSRLAAQVIGKMQASYPDVSWIKVCFVKFSDL